MKLIALLLVPMLAACQTAVSLKGPAKPPVINAQVPKDAIDIVLLSSVAVSGPTLNVTLTKQPAPNSAIRLDYVGSVYGSNTVGVVFPDTTQTLAQQKVLVITLPDPPPGGYTVADRIFITYKTLDP